MQEECKRLEVQLAVKQKVLDELYLLLGCTEDNPSQLAVQIRDLQAQIDNITKQYEDQRALNHQLYDGPVRTLSQICMLTGIKGDVDCAAAVDRIQGLLEEVCTLRDKMANKKEFTEGIDWDRSLKQATSNTYVQQETDNVNSLRKEVTELKAQVAELTASAEYFSNKFSDLCKELQCTEDYEGRALKELKTLIQKRNDLSVQVSASEITYKNLCGLHTDICEELGCSAEIVEQCLDKIKKLCQTKRSLQAQQQAQELLRNTVDSEFIVSPGVNFHSEVWTSTNTIQEEEALVTTSECSTFETVGSYESFSIEQILEEVKSESSNASAFSPASCSTESDSDDGLSAEELSTEHAADDIQLLLSSTKPSATSFDFRQELQFGVSDWNATVDDVKLSQVDEMSWIVSYVVSVSQGHTCWRLHKTYDDFCGVYMVLKLRYKFEAISEFMFPSKDQNFQDTDSFFNERIQKLNIFVETMMMLQPMPSIVQDFFELEKHSTKDTLNYVVLIQKWYKRWKVERNYQFKRRQAIKIQTWWRSLLRYARLQALIVVVHKFYAIFRKWNAAQDHQVHRNNNAMIIQAKFKCWKKQKLFQLQKKNSIIIQNRFRSYIKQKKFKVQRTNAIIIQAWFRCQRKQKTFWAKKEKSSCYTKMVLHLEEEQNSAGLCYITITMERQS